jgi:mRNA interferase RelE/StbE
VAEVRFIDAAIEDLTRLSHDIRLRVFKKLLLLEKDPGAGRPLGGSLTGYRKLVVGNRDWRIVYRATQDGNVEICEVYREAAGRIASLPSNPTTHTLAQVLGRLGYGPVPEPEPEAPPAWLVARLVHTARRDPNEVAAMTLDEALQAWTDYQSQGPT